MRRIGVLLALVATLAAITAGPASSANVHAAGKCRQVTQHNRLAALATVLSTHAMSCRSARLVIRRHGREAGSGAFRKGGRFAMGAFRCRVLSAVEESNVARCRNGARTFRVNYGS